MKKGFTQEFRVEAVRQVAENGHPVAEVAARLGVSAHSLYQWIKQYGPASGGQASQLSSRDDEIRRLKAEVRRLTEERDILKKAAVDSIGERNTEYSLDKRRGFCDGTIRKTRA